MAEEKYFRDACVWNLSKSETFSPANQIARNKHNDEELELLGNTVFSGSPKSITSYQYCNLI